jgi:hypothetical protein
MSGVVPHGQGAGRQAEALATAGARRSRSCDRWVAAGIVVVVTAGAVSAGMVSPAASPGAGGHAARSQAHHGIASQPDRPGDGGLYTRTYRPRRILALGLVAAQSARVPGHHQQR